MSKLETLTIEWFTLEEDCTPCFEREDSYHIQTVEGKVFHTMYYNQARHVCWFESKSGFKVPREIVAYWTFNIYPKGVD